MSKKKRSDLSNKYLAKLFEHLNDRFFGGRLLPTIEVKFAKLDKTAAIGVWRPLAVQILIERRLAFSPSIVTTILLHEMIHADLGVNYRGDMKEGGHGMIFQGELVRLWKAGAYDGLL